MVVILTVLNLTINKGDTSYKCYVTCDSYTWNDSTYTQSGTYYSNIGSNNNYSMNFDGIDDYIDVNPIMIKESQLSIEIWVHPKFFSVTNRQFIRQDDVGVTHQSNGDLLICFKSNTNSW